MKRSKSGRAWMQQHVSDPYVKLAQKEGYRSRAAYKLLEIQRRERLIRSGSVVVDLGAAPGGWSQVCAQRVGPAGRVVAIDLLPMDPLPGVEFLQADFATEEGLAELETLLQKRKPDLVMSDMAPNLSGITAADQARHYRLAELALEFARLHLQEQGAFVVKVFHGEGYDAFRAAMAKTFQTLSGIKPEASRDRSREVYLVGKCLRKSSGTDEFNLE